jgi:hypothetical protein
MQRYAALYSAMQRFASVQHDIQNEANRPIGPSPNPLPAIAMIA